MEIALFAVWLQNKNEETVCLLVGRDGYATD